MEAPKKTLNESNRDELRRSTLKMNSLIFPENDTSQVDFGTISLDEATSDSFTARLNSLVGSLAYQPDMRATEPLGFAITVDFANIPVDITFCTEKSMNSTQI